FDEDHAEGLGPVNWREERAGAPHQLAFMSLSEWPNQVDEGIVQEWLYHLVEVGAVCGIDLGGDLQRDTGPLRNGNRAVRALLGGDAPHKDEIASRRCRERETLHIHPVIDGRYPADVRNRLALAVADRDEMSIWIRVQEAHQGRLIQPRM